MTDVFRTTRTIPTMVPRQQEPSQQWINRTPSAVPVLAPPQRSYLDTLAKQAGEELPGNLTKAEASRHIDRLQSETGRGSHEAR